MARLYPADVVFKVLIPIALKLCEDPVWEVRRKAAKRLAEMLIFYQNSPETLPLKIQILAFRDSNRFNMRQT